MNTLRVATWNVEWRSPRSQAASIIRTRLTDLRPDVVCLTETYADFLPDRGYVIEADPDYGYPIKEGRRKVLLWSAEPWTQVDALGATDLPSGRYVSGRTQTALGEVDVVGVCIPWRGAHVTTGRRDRRPWQDHLSYLTGLEPTLTKRDRRTIVLGDFNQRIPRTGAPQASFAALERALLSRFEVPSAGLIPPFGEPLIDHVAHTPDLRTVEVMSMDRRGPRDERLSDHLGLFVEMTAREDQVRL